MPATGQVPSSVDRQPSYTNLALAGVDRPVLRRKAAKRCGAWMGKASPQTSQPTPETVGPKIFTDGLYRSHRSRIGEGWGGEGALQRDCA